MIFYFSATGNSEHVARRVAEATGDGIVSMTEHPEGPFDGSGSIGIVTPTYFWGLPTVVREFLQGMTFDRTPDYLWFAATYGTTPGRSDSYAEEILGKNGLSISARFCIKMPDTWTPIFDLSDGKKVACINANAEKEIDSLISAVAERRCGNFMKGRTPVFLTEYAQERYESARRTDHFHVEDKCIGCGLCAKRCPASVIEIRDERPVWTEERCVMCLSCLHRCPKFAIQYGKRTAKHGQYVHPRRSALRDRRPSCPFFSSECSVCSPWTNSSMSPGWQSSVSHIASRVENLTPWTFPVLIFDRLTYDIPTFSASSLRLILRSAMMRSRRRMIVMVSQELVRFRLQGGAVFEDQVDEVRDGPGHQYVPGRVEEIHPRSEDQDEQRLDQDHGHER